MLTILAKKDKKRKREKVDLKENVILARLHARGGSRAGSMVGPSSKHPGKKVGGGRLAAWL